jgi:cephalosporin hydroxylase
MSNTAPAWLDWICAAPDRAELTRRYDDWAERYDGDVAAEWDGIPQWAAGLLGRLLGRRDAPVLDAGAGTGLAGVGLAAVGFRHLIALDISPGMLEQAAARGVYRATRVGAIADAGVLGAEERFAGIVATGIFAAGHCGPAELECLAGHLAPGGVLVFTARGGVLDALMATLEGLDGALLDALESRVYDDQPIHAVAWQAAGGAPRWVPITAREQRSDIPAAAARPTTERWADVRWRGVAMDKGPFEQAILPQLIDEQQIQSVIELGTGQGGAALWYADLLALHGAKVRVVTVERDPDVVDPAVRDHPDVHCITGDCRRLPDILPPALLAELPHPWLVVEDAHDLELPAILDYLDGSGLRRGDYLVIEDTNSDLLAAWPDWPVRGKLRRKDADLRTWLAAQEARYRIDTWYQDLFGYNAAKTWNGILRLMR